MMPDKIEIAVIQYTGYYPDEQMSYNITHWDSVSEEEYEALKTYIQRENSQRRGSAYTLLRRVDLVEFDLPTLLKRAKEENQAIALKEQSKVERLKKRLATMQKLKEARELKQLESLKAKYETRDGDR